MYKCFNCASNDLPHNHKATDPMCLFRSKYDATMLSARNKNKRNTYQNRNISSSSSNNNNNTYDNRRFVDAPASPPLTSSFAYTAAIRSNTRTNTQSSHESAPSASHNDMPFTNTNIHTNQASPKLFTFAQITQLLMESINELKQCKSKTDQIAVVAKLLQYAFD